MNGKTLLQISSSNTGVTSASFEIYTSNWDYIGSMTLPVGYFGTNNFSLSSDTGYVRILVSPLTANKNVKGSITVATN